MTTMSCSIIHSSVQTSVTTRGMFRAAICHHRLSQPLPLPGTEIQRLITADHALTSCAVDFRSLLSQKTSENSTGGYFISVFDGCR